MISAKKRRFLNVLGVKLIALAMILVGLFFLADLSFRPIVETVNAYECHSAVSDVINKAVLGELDREDTDYSKLVELTMNNEGEVVSLESNIMNINRLKTSVADRVERDIERLSAVDINIPIGTLAGIQLLHGKGFNIGMRVEPIGYATTTIISEFTDAGINQTRHRIVIEVKADVDAVIPGYSSNVHVVSTIVAAETIIVGRVPGAYTHVISSDHDLIGTLEDYGSTL